DEGVGNAESPDRVPDPDAADRDALGPGIALAELSRRRRARVRPGIPRPVQRQGTEDPILMFRPHDARIADESGQRARGIGAAAEAEEIEFVSRPVIADQPAIAFDQ